MKKQFLFLLLAVIFLSSCATATLSEFPGVGRVKQYDFYSYDIPPAFDGFRIGFASDFHYESRFKRSEQCGTSIKINACRCSVVGWRLS